MRTCMTFVKTECPECAETIIMDVVNGYGYCMYCGAKVEPEGLRRFSSPLRIAIRKELEFDDPSISEPWYEDVCEAISLMLSGEKDAGAALIRSVYGSAKDDDEMARISNTLSMEILEYVVSVMDRDEGEPYRGGALDIIGVIREFDDIYPTEILDLCLAQMTIGTFVSGEIAKTTLISISYLAQDLLTLSRSATDAVELLGHICSLATEIARSAYPEDSDIDRSEEAVRRLMFLMDAWSAMLAVTDEMTQKDHVKANRALSASGFDEVLASLEEAFSKAMDGEDAYREPLYRYVWLMCGSPSQGSRKGGKRSKA